MSKGFDQSAVAGAITQRRSAVTGAGRIWLEVNGESRQQGDLADMMWKVPEIIANLSTLVRPEAGDLIYTGTPAGRGPATGVMCWWRSDGIASLRACIV